ncbi:MAG: hypothetical protein KDC34_03085 [Saprospiraceae bacterium]|nr:hypothetical protein [Saprospiraceae bacterium]
MVKFTKHTLKKLESLFEEQEYIVRYEKGTFQSGYCLVENRKIAIINKFFDTEARIKTLIDILQNIELNNALFSDASLKLYADILKAEAKIAREGQSEEE